jgi:multidrug efflux pump
VTGSRLFLQAAQDLLIGGRQSSAQFQYSISADNLQDLNEWTTRILKEFKKIDGIVDVNTDVRDNGLQIFVNVDRDRAARYGITSSLIDRTLYGAFGQQQVSTMYSNMNQYHVIMEAAPQFWQNPASLKDIYVFSPTNAAIPLPVLATFKPSSTLLSVHHQGQAPSATFSFNLLPNVALGDTVNSVSNTIKRMNLPPSIIGAFQGTAQAFQASVENEIYLIIAALLAVYIILGILYESLIHPITILSTLPSAGVGALLALIISRQDLTIIAFIGIILLIGIVKKNAIMMIDFALQIERNENKSSVEAIYQAAIMRFRPIMMTTMTALLGALPLVFGFGLGSEIRRPLGIAIIGGLIMSQLLTIYTTPVIYLVLDRLTKQRRHHFKSATPQEG